MKTTYIVGGYQRCGTSMMMKALHAGGLDPARSVERDKAMNDKAGDEHYVPNEEYYELSPQDYRSPSFPWPHEGKLIKSLQGGPLRLPAGNYKIVFMMRDPVEIIESYQGAFNSRPPGTANALQCWQTLTGTLQKLTLRRDVDVVPVWYNVALEMPGQVFEELYRQGWPIDMQKAAEVVNPDLKRFHAAETKATAYADGIPVDARGGPRVVTECSDGGVASWDEFRAAE